MATTKKIPTRPWADATLQEMAPYFPDARTFMLEGEQVEFLLTWGATRWECSGRGLSSFRPLRASECRADTPEGAMRLMLDWLLNTGHINGVLNDPLKDKTLEELLALLPEDFTYNGEQEVSYFYLSHSKGGCACVALKETGEDECAEVWVDVEGEDERLAEHGKTPREAVIAMLVRLKKNGHVNY